jgi:hypothetical protein
VREQSSDDLRGYGSPDAEEARGLASVPWTV